MAKTTDLFPHTIYEVDYPEFDKIQSALLNYINTNYEAELMTGYNGHDHPIKLGSLTRIYDAKESKAIPGAAPAADIQQIDDDNLKAVFDWITYHGKEYWNTLNFSKHLDPYILQLWATSVTNGGFVSSHNHNPVPVSGVFYVKAEPKLGNLYLENPLDLVIGKSIYHNDNRTPTRFNHEVEAISGKLVLFPGWMKHFTKPNPTGELRMSMAVNFGCHGQVYYTEYA